MDSEEQLKDWKLKLRYGKMKTPFHHYTVIAEGLVEKLEHGFECRQGPAFMGMKTWATSSEESADMITAIGKDIGFKVTGRIQIYETEPSEPPCEKPYGYNINFTSFDSDK
jgi:hypothetical protein